MLLVTGRAIKIYSLRLEICLSLLVEQSISVSSWITYMYIPGDLVITKAYSSNCSLGAAIQVILLYVFDVTFVIATLLRRSYGRAW